MHFNKKFPGENGYYWYIDLEYPVPVIGFIQGNELHAHTQVVHKEHDSGTSKFIRIGDRINEPDCKYTTYEQ